VTNEIEFPVESVHVRLFSRAVGGEAVFELGRGVAEHPSPGGPIAPPTFTESLQLFTPDYRWRPTFDRPWVGSGATPSGVERVPTDEAVLHAEQHFEYRRHIRVGDRLTARSRPGRSWTKQNRRGELLVFREIVTEFSDQSGEIAVISTAVEVETPMSKEPE
jgi:hypothetical protein